MNVQLHHVVTDIAGAAGPADHPRDPRRRESGCENFIHERGARGAVNRRDEYEIMKFRLTPPAKRSRVLSEIEGAKDQTPKIAAL